MGASVGSFLFDRWEGEPPPLNKPMVELQFRTGVTNPSARVLPAQATEGSWVGVVYVDLANRITVPKAYRSIIGTVVTVNFGSDSWGSFLVRDVHLLSIERIPHASGIDAGGVPFSYTPAVKITSRWHLVSRS